MEGRSASAVENNASIFGETVLESKRLFERLVKHLEEKDPEFLKDNAEQLISLAKAVHSNSTEIKTVTDASRVCEERIRDNVQAQLDGNATQPFDATTVFETEKQAARAKQPRAEQDAFIKAIEGAVQKVMSSSNEEMTVVHTEQRHLCPITKQPFVDPVRNKRCGHVYEREAVKSLMDSNRLLGCPVVGCGNNKTLVWADLQPHTELKEQLAAEKQAMASSGRKHKA